MQIHEITQRKTVNEVLGGLGSFMSGLTGGMSDKYMDKTPGAGKEQNTSTDWKERYQAIQKDPTVMSYVKGLGASWAKTAGTLVKPTQGLTSIATLQKTIPTLVSAAKKTNNNLTSTQIGQILAKSAPTVWSNTADKPAAIAQLKNELEKQGVTVDAKAAPVSKTAPITTTPNADGTQVTPAGIVIPSTVGGQARKESRQDTNEAVATGPAADQYRTAFIQWSDGQLATRVRETGETVTMDAVQQQFPDLATELKSALDKIVASRGTPQQAQAVEYYVELAVAGVQAVAQISKNKTSATDRQQNKQFPNTAGTVKQSLRNAGVDPDKLAQFGAQAKEAGDSMQARRTGNDSLNTLAKLAGYTLV